jgi:hypothetical protein
MRWANDAVREVLRQWKSNELSYSSALQQLTALNVKRPDRVLTETEEHTYHEIGRS